MADWRDKVKDPFVINTGDGERYVVKSLMSSFSLVTEYQTSEFTFIGVSGSFVERKLPIGSKYNLEVFFDGSDHVEQAEKFRISCTDKRPWTIEHPLYGLLNVQITSLNWDNSQGNCTKVSGTVIESITDGPPNVSVNPLDQIPILFEVANEDLAVSLDTTILPADINTLTNDNNAVYAKGVPITTPLGGEFEKYTNAFNTASTYINTATATPLLMMRSVINVITLPSTFAASVKARMKVLVDTFNELRQNLFGFISVSSKQLFQNKEGSTISAMCNAAGAPLPTDFKNASQVLEVIDQIVNARRTFIADLDSLQSSNAGSPLSYVPNAQALISLNNLINTTISGLYNLSLSARSERSLICEKDTNIILLAHRLYGLDPNDNNMNDLIEENDLALEEYLQIRKGRKIVYYI